MSKSKRAILESLETRRLLTIFSVTNTDDSGAGSLRQAITSANSAAGTDEIHFDIGSGLQKISPNSALPDITGTLTIDGTTQSGFAGMPLIELDGSNVSGSGLIIKISDCVIAGLVIHSFTDNGILINGVAATGNTVHGCFIGLDPTGAGHQGNFDDGIEISGGASGNTIGGTTAADRNIISGAEGNGDGVFIDQSNDNIVIGNYIGTDVTGTIALANNLSGIEIAENSKNNRVGGKTAGERNIISGNNRAGVTIANPGTTGNVVQGNYIGTDVTGTAALANTQGVEFFGAATGNLLGGSTAAARNIISGNAQAGVLLDQPGTTGNEVLGNYIGTDVTGRHALHNQNGVSILVQASGNSIGGKGATRGNLISGNSVSGILVSGVGADNNVIRGNRIGCDATDKRALPNGGRGIFITGAKGTVIGGKAKGSGNFIAFNHSEGIGVNSNSTATTISRNGIYRNGGLGIDLIETSGVTLNDKLDADAGGNLQLNFPTLLSATQSGATLTVAGTYAGEKSKSFTLEFFSSAAADAPTGFGEGRFFIGAINITTDTKGNATFSAPLKYTLPANFVVTATATDRAGNTSEFSAAAGYGIISGQAFIDVNGDNIKNGSDSGFKSARIFLDLDESNDLNGTEPSQLTNAKGLFAFALPPGTYRLLEKTPDGYDVTAGSTGYTVDVVAGQSQSFSFGNVPLS